VISTCTSACTLFNTEGMPRSLFDFESILCSPNEDFGRMNKR